MDWLTFTSSIVTALAWPLVALIAVFLLRVPLKEWLVQRPTRLKAGPLEVEWATELSRAEAALDQPGVPDPRRIDVADHHLDLLARTTPAMAVATAADQLEAALTATLGDEDASALGLVALAAEAQSRGRITAGTRAAVENLAVLRNVAVHSPELVTERQALGYVSAVRAALGAIEVGSSLSERLRAGTDNVDPSDVSALLRMEGPDAVVALAATSDSNVKQRQAAALLARAGHYDAAVDIAERIQNRAEARAVARAVLMRAKEHPDTLEPAWEAVRRLWPRLRAPQRRDMRSFAAEVGLLLPEDLAQEPADRPGDDDGDDPVRAPGPT